MQRLRYLPQKGFRTQINNEYSNNINNNNNDSNAVSGEQNPCENLFQSETFRKRFLIGLPPSFYYNLHFVHNPVSYTVITREWLQRTRDFLEYSVLHDEQQIRASNSLCCPDLCVNRISNKR